MLIVIISVLAMIFTAKFVGEEMWAESFGEWLFAISVGIFTGFFVLIAFGLPLSYNLPKTINYQEKNIVSLQDSVGIQGTFFLGSGSIKGNPTYTFYTEEDGGFKLNNVNASSTLIKYGDQPKTKYESGCDGVWQWIAPCAYSSSEPVEVTVPEGTIKQNFTLDAQ